MKGPEKPKSPELREEKPLLVENLQESIKIAEDELVSLIEAKRTGKTPEWVDYRGSTAEAEEKSTAFQLDRLLSIEKPFTDLIIVVEKLEYPKYQLSEGETKMLELEAYGRLQEHLLDKDKKLNKRVAENLLLGLEVLEGFAEAGKDIAINDEVDAESKQESIHNLPVLRKAIKLVKKVIANHPA